MLDSFAQIVSKPWTSSVKRLNFVVLDFIGPRTGLKEPVGDANLIIISFGLQQETPNLKLSPQVRVCKLGIRDCVQVRTRSGDAAEHGSCEVCSILVTRDQGAAWQYGFFTG